MLTLVYSMFFLTIGVFFATFACKYLFTPTDDLYSDFRNKKDFGERYFKKELRIKRIVFTSLATIFIVIGLVILFSA